MNQKNSLSSRFKGLLQDRNALWIAAFALLALLCAVLFFVVNSWVLKILFLLILFGAIVYCWLLLESRRNTLKTARKTPAPPLPDEAPAVEQVEETPETAEAGEDEGESPLPDEEEAPQVFVSEKGDKYHLDRNCVGLRFADSVENMSEEKAILLKRKPCSRCGRKPAEE